MRIIRDLLDILPSVILYLASGCVFLQVFRFVALKERNQEINHLLTMSLVIGYIIVTIMNIIPFAISYQIDCIGIVFTSAAAGFLLGKIYMSNQLNKILQRLHIYTTTKESIWMNYIDFEYPCYLTIHMGDGTIYSGYYKSMEGNVRDPLIVLAAYKHTSESNEILLEDHENDENFVVMLDMKKLKSVEFQYYRNSEMCQPIKEIIENHDAPGSPTYHLHHPEE